MWQKNFSAQPPAKIAIACDCDHAATLIACNGLQVCHPVRRLLLALICPSSLMTILAGNATAAFC